MKALLSPFPFALVAAAVTAQTCPTDAEFAAVRAHVVPDDSVEAWREAGWRMRLDHAVLEAAAADRPVVLWAMNGHPFGCT